MRGRRSRRGGQAAELPGASEPLALVKRCALHALCYRCGVSDAPDELHESLVASNAAFVDMPDTQVIVRPGWLQRFTPSMPDGGGMNEVVTCQLRADEADAVIDRAIAMYRGAGVQHRWRVGPDTTPSDLGARLEARGLTPDGGSALARALSVEPQALPRGVEVVCVDEQSVDAYTQLMAEGWGGRPGPMAAFHRGILSSTAPRLQLCLLRLDGQPVAGAGVALLARSAFLVGGVVLPGFRGRGLYRALVRYREQLAAAQGLRLATTHARASTSMPVLLKLGYHEICPLMTYADLAPT